jgi:hypothetical protein
MGEIIDIDNFKPEIIINNNVELFTGKQYEYGKNYSDPIITIPKNYIFYFKTIEIDTSHYGLFDIEFTTSKGVIGIIRQHFGQKSGLYYNPCYCFDPIHGFQYVTMRARSTCKTKEQVFVSINDWHEFEEIKENNKYELHNNKIC